MNSTIQTAMYLVDGVVTELTIEEALQISWCKIPIIKIGGKQ